MVMRATSNGDYATPADFDLVITNGSIIDGTG
jgi:hypothetical protein